MDDVVLLNDKDIVQGQCPPGRISHTLPSGDRKVRKALVTLNKDGKNITYERPTSMVIPLNCYSVLIDSVIF